MGAGETGGHPVFPEEEKGKRYPEAQKEEVMMIPVEVLVDVDGVIRDIVSACDRLYRERFPGANPVLGQGYDLSLRYPQWGESTWEIVFNENAERIFYLDAAPYPEAVEAVRWLQASQAEYGLRVRFLTKQDGLRVDATKSWLQDHELVEDPESENELVIVSSSNKGDYLRGLVADEDILDLNTVVVLDDSVDELESMIDVTRNTVLVPVCQPWTVTEMLHSGLPYVRFPEIRRVPDAESTRCSCVAGVTISVVQEIVQAITEGWAL